MKTVDNFKLIKSLLKFNNSDEFYFLQIIQRKKDGNNGLHVRNGYRLIKSYYIYSVNDLESLEDRIKELCNNNNARAYINMNVRNAKEVALTCISKYSELVLNNNSFMGNNVWESSCGSTRARTYKALWLIDIDDIKLLSTIASIIFSCKHNPEFTFYSVPTVNGAHIICNGFDTRDFYKKLEDNNIGKVDIHKNNPTLLYYNDISSNSK